MDLEPDGRATSTINTNGVVESAYYPQYSYVAPVTPVMSSFTLQEAPDTYDPSHDYFDVKPKY